MERTPNLLEKAMGENWNDAVIIEDCVETSASFVLHHLIRRFLSPQSSSFLIFVAYAQPFSHYERILRKMNWHAATEKYTKLGVFSSFFVENLLLLCAIPPLGMVAEFSFLVSYSLFGHQFLQLIRGEKKVPQEGCNLLMHKDNKKLLFLEMLKLECSDGLGRKTGEAELRALYRKIYKAVEITSLSKSNKNIVIMIDDISLMEVAANGSSDDVLDFLHYCHTLTTQFGCSFVVLTHEDIYSATDKAILISQMEYLADVLVKAEPLPTGLATDVHGQLTVLNKCSHDCPGSSTKKMQNFHFRLKESCAEYFYPGSQT